ncbi:MAG: hypothetical protein ABI806_00475 [Candidatus Solibacter sp.]
MNMTIFGERAFWSGRRVFVTGGGFIGSMLVDRLVDLDASVTVAERPERTVTFSRARDIGPADCTPTRERAALIARCCGPPQLKLKFDTSKPQAQVFRNADISRAERRLGFRPVVTLKEGRRYTLAWRGKQLSQRQIGV